jgi:hypothetical protein
MKQWQRGLLGGVTAISLVALVAPAEAQGRGGIVVRSQRGRAWGVRTVPPGDPPLFAPFSSGAIERNFAIMRDTSPNPATYMAGQLNSRRAGVRLGYRSNDFAIGVGYSSGYYDYGHYGSYYGGYGGYCGPYGYPAYPYYPVMPTLYPWGYAVTGAPAVTRERVVIIQGAAPTQPNPPARQEAAPAEPPSPPPSRGDSEYYLAPKAERGEEGLTEALMEIRKAWLNGDHARLKARIRDNAKVRIYPGGKYEYSVTAADFAQMTRDAMSRLDTLSFELNAPKTLAEGRAFVAGTHVYKDADGEKREVSISYVLIRDEGRWYIAEVGSGSGPIQRHAE